MDKCLHPIISTLTFGELWGFTSFLETNFLPLNNSRVPSQKPFPSQRYSVVLTHLQQCTSNAKGDCLSLTGEATPMSFDKHIVITFISQGYQWDFDILKPQWIALKIFLHNINRQNHKDHVNNSMKLFGEQNGYCNSLRHIHHTRICSKRKTKISYPIGFKGHPWTVCDFRRLIVHISYSSPWYHHSITTQLKYFVDMITIWHLIHDWGTTKIIGTFNQLEIRKLNLYLFFG